MRADIHDGPEHMLQSEAGYIDARPLTPARQNLLQRTAGPYIWVNRVVLTVRCSLPVYPDERTSSEPVGMSQRCQQRTLFPCLNGLEHPSAPSALLLCKLQGAIRKRAGIAS